MINLKENDYYVVYNDYFREDFSKELNLLYLPLIGSDAVKLYSFFFTKILNDNNMTNNLLHFDIFDNMVFDKKKFIFIRKKLEALGLLETYLTESDNKTFYVYKIKKPLSFSQFFSNQLLSTILENTIGDVSFNLIKEKYGVEKLNFKSFQNISAKFSDVYSDYELQGEDILNDDKLEGPNLNEYYFDFTKLNFYLTNLYIEDILEDKRLKNIILELAHLYKVSPEEMASALEASLEAESGGTTVNVEKLKDYLTQLFVNVKKQNVPTLDNMINKKLVYSSYKDDNKLSEKELLAKKLDSISYIEFLNKKYGIILSKVDASNVLKVQEKYNFPAGVLNVLLDYAIYNSNSGGVPNFNYIDKIASTWSSQKLLNALDAINFVNEQNKKRKAKPKTAKENFAFSKSNSNNRRINKTPDYIKEQLESVGNSETKERIISKVDEEEYEKFKKLLEEKGIE